MRKILKKTAAISSLTLASRILGVVRDMVIAVIFGTSVFSDAFFIAFRPFDLIRKLFSEGILGVSFIPVFTDTLENHGKISAISLMYSFFCLLSAGAVVVMIAAVIFAPAVMMMIAPGFAPSSYEYYLTIVLFKMMLPYFWLILTAGLGMSVLNAFENFTAPAAAPIAFNITMILFVCLARPFFDIQIMVLSSGVVISGFLQLAVQIPFMIRTGMFKSVRFGIFNPQSLRIIKIMVPTMVGAASYQINILVASFFASNLDEGSVTCLYYADRLVQFPLALFGVSVATVFLPDLSRKNSTGAISDMGPLFTNAVMMVLFVTIPAMAGLMALNRPIVALLFGHGAFDAAAVRLTSQCLFFLVSGLWAFSLSRLFSTLYYSMSKRYLPFYVGLITMGANIVLSSWLIQFFSLEGIAMAVSLSAMAGCLVMFAYIPGEVNIDKKRIILCACRSVFFAGIMFLCVRAAADVILENPMGKAISALSLLACILWGILCYAGLNFLLSTPEMKLFIKGFKKN